METAGWDLSYLLEWLISGHELPEYNTEAVYVYREGVVLPALHDLRCHYVNTST